MNRAEPKRKVDYLRISVTDRCNFRCRYCMPPEGVPLLKHADILTFEEIIRVVRLSRELGFVRFRLTGGEPLVRRGLVELVRGLTGVAGIEDLSLTTNGHYLPDLALSLRRAGLDRINLSLDALSPAIFSRMTRGGDLSRVLAGHAAAVRAGFPPPRLNAVIIPGINDGEILPLVDFARAVGSPLRFIEMMPVTPDSGGSFMPGERVRRLIEERFPLEEADGTPGGGPARYWRGPDFLVGFISPLSEDICSNCRRMRLTADGFLRPCLAAEDEFDLRPALRERGDLREVFLRALAAKPPRHRFGCRPDGGRRMSAIGG